MNEFVDVELATSFDLNSFSLHRTVIKTADVIGHCQLNIQRFL